MANDTRRKLYTALNNAGFDIGSYEDFDRRMNNQADRKKFYDAVSNAGYDIGNYYAFNKRITPSKYSLKIKGVNTPVSEKEYKDFVSKHQGQTAQPAKTQTTAAKQPRTQPAAQAKQAAAPAPATQQAPTPMQFPDGFGQFDAKTAGMSAWERENYERQNQHIDAHAGDGKPKPKPKQESDIDTLDRALKGDQEAAKKSGLEAANKRMQEEVAYMEATGKELRNPINLPGTAPTAVQDENGNMLIGQTTDEHRVAQYQQEEKERARRELIYPLVDEIINGIRSNKGKNPEDILLPGEGLYQLRATNEAHSPEAIMKALDEYFGSGEKEDFTTRFLLENQDAIKQAASQVGMDVDDYVMRELIPQMSNTIAERFGQNMSEEYSVKGTSDYLMKRMLSSGIGALVRMGGTHTRKQSQYMQEELEKSRTGEGQHFNASWYDKAVGEVAQFLPDAPLMLIGGEIGGAAIKGLGAAISRLGGKAFGKLVSTGSPFLAANVGKLTKHGAMLTRGIVGGAANMGTFMGSSSMLQYMATHSSSEDGYWSGLGLAGLEGAEEGAKMGAALGVLGYGSHLLGKVPNTAAGRASVLGGAFLAENQIFAMSDYLADPEKFSWVDSSLDALYMQMAGKVSGLTTHGSAGIAESFRRIFTPEPKMPTLTEEDKAYIQRAFGGMDFVDIAGDMRNLEKILADKQNIPLTVRQKVSGRVLGVFEPNRPHTYKTSINGNTIYERAKDGELLDVHTFKDKNERDEILQQISERKANDEMISYYNILKLRENIEPTELDILKAKNEITDEFEGSDEDLNTFRASLEKGGENYQLVLDRANEIKRNQAQAIIDEFAGEYGYTPSEVRAIMEKRPIDRTDEEMDAMFVLSKRLHDAAYPKGEMHVEQSEVDGQNMAGEGGVVNPDTSAQIAAELNESREAYQNFLNQHEEMRDAIGRLGENARLDEVYMYVAENYSGSERDTLLELIADYANASAKRDGFIRKTGDNIDETVNREIEANSFLGTLDDAPDTENVITIIHDNQRLTLLNGKVGTRTEPGVVDIDTGVSTNGARMVDPDKSGGLIIALDENGNWVSLKPDARMEIAELMPKEEYANNLREELGVGATATMTETGLVEEPAAPSTESEDAGEGGTEEAPAGAQVAGEDTEGGNAGGEAGAEGTGGNEPPAAAPLREESINNTPEGNEGGENAVTLQSQLEAITDNDGVKHYEQGIDPQVAIDDMKAGKIDPIQMADAMIGEAQGKIQKWAKKKNKKPADLVKEAKETQEAQAAIEYWTQLRDKEMQSRISAAAEARRKADEAAAKKAQEATVEPSEEEVKAERDERFKANREKFEQSKEDGDEDTIVLANGESIEGHYVLVEADAVTPSHNPRGNFAKSEGFPVDENGKTINDRDYENDKNAQVLVQKRSQAYDQRAVSTPVVVSEDGIVLSGNDRTMSGQLAAEQGTDGAYVDYITKHAKKWGFTPEQVSGKEHPRIVFVPKERMEYNAETFAKFNQDEKKSQSKLESAVKMGKVLATKPETLSRIGSVIDQVENLSDLYSDAELTKKVLLAMKEGGLITDEGIARLTDENGLLSAQGKDEFETMLAGVVVDEDALRILNNPENGLGELRKAIAYASVPLVKNQVLGEYSIIKDLSEAVRLYHGAKGSQLIGKDGDITNYFINRDAFDGAPMDTHSLTQLMLANQMSKGGYHLKRVIEKYNEAAQPAANKELDWTVGGIRSKEDILTDILKQQGYDAESIRQRVERLRETQPPVEVDTRSGTGREGKGDEAKGEGRTEPEQPADGKRVDAEKDAAEIQQPTEQDEYLKPRNDKEKEIISDVEKKLAEDIAEQQKKVNKAKQKWDDETAKVNQRPEAGLFGDEVEERPKKAGDQLEMFEGEEKPALDVSEENLRKQVKEYEDDYRHEQQELERLKSKAEHDSRVRGALDNERLQTEIPSGEPEGTVAPNEDPMVKIEETATEFKKEQDKKIGITHDETPEQKAEHEGEEILSQPLLSEAEIDGSSLEPEQKTWAKSYLRGKRGELETEAYIEAYEDVRNRRQDNEGDRPDADKAQLVGSEDNGEQRPGRTDEPAVAVDTTTDVPEKDNGRPESAGVQRVEDSKDDVPVPAGERGDSSVSESKPAVDGLSSGGEQPDGSRDTGRSGHHVRGGRDDKPSSRVAGEAGQRDTKAQRKEIKGEIDDLLSQLRDLRKKNKGDGKTFAVVDPVTALAASVAKSNIIPKNKEERQIFWKLASATARYGYTYFEDGITKFNEWKDKIINDLVDPIKEVFNWGKDEVDRYIEQVWNSDYEINGITRTMGEWASFIGEEQLKKVVREDLGTKFEKQKAAESIEVKTGDIDNIRETLPYLLPEQQDDVLKAETQFFDETHQDREHGNGKGMMFTNGTGTGKTYTGLGIVKRFVKQGKGRVLILTPSQEKVEDWRKDGMNLGLTLESLDEEAKAKGTSATKSKGKGVVVTTYANARQNLAMLEDCFDLIVYDESHKIMESKEATNTTMMEFHEMLTNKNVEKSIDRQTYWLPEWIEHRNLIKERAESLAKIEELDQLDTSEAKEQIQHLESRLTEISARLDELRPIMQEIRESKREQAEIDSKRTKTVFLSATPFNVRESLRYAEGYLFSFPEEDKNTIGTYNHRSPEDAFLEQMFPAGYRWRYGRLESHVSNAEALGRQEIDFSDYLQNTLHTMSGRMIASDYDYSRDFPVMTLDHAGRFNQAMSEVYRNKKYQPLAEAFRKAFDYNYSTALFEAMKTSLVIERIREHLKRGHKVVVFHRRRTSGDLEPPFRRALNLADAMAAAEQDMTQKSKILSAIKAFEHDFADMLDWEKTIDYTLPREQIEKVFGSENVGFFSGAETKRTKHKSVEEFMKDNGGKDIIVIQEASGKEGISLHDQTGEHQRVEINLALPQSPIAFIQIEGRIYRIGQKSNAIFEYPLLGLDLETNLFAQRFNGALGTTENLALGSKARNLRKSIANSVLENTGEVDYDRQGLGGKDMDGRVASSGDKDGFDVSIQDYYGNQKMQRGRDNREGVDYFPTPEPIGYKMVEWGQMMDGETALEPSAGHGAIARYVPETNGMTAIEPSSSLFTKLQMRAGGPGRRFEEMSFEEYPVSNKHDVVLMNPPYGVGGKTAMEHVAKAFRHLNEGGRIIAIIPDGPAMEKRFDAWLVSEGMNGAAVVTGEVKLPSAAFGRAGTSVRTRVVVIDKVSRAEMREKMPQKVTVDLSGEETIGGLFDRIRNVRMPERTIDAVAINTKKALRTKSGILDNPFATGFDITGNLLHISNRSRMSLNDVYIDLENPNIDNILARYRDMKEAMEKPEEVDYGKFASRTFGRGKNAVPAVDAIKDYCEKVIKTLENISGMTADQMDRMLREKEEERQRREAERVAEIERLRAERQQKKKDAIATFNEEFKEDKTLDKGYIESLIIRAHSNDWSKTDAQNVLARYGIDWETGKKVSDYEAQQRERNLERDFLGEPMLGYLKEHLKRAHSNNAREAVESQEILKANGVYWQTGEMTSAEKQRRAQETARSSQNSAYSYKLDKNTRTGEDMHLVNMNTRLDDADYKAVERKAKANGGYYNRFKKAWHFKTEEDARKFMESVNASDGNDGSPTTRFRLREKEASQTPLEADFRRKEEAGRKLAKKLNMDFEAVTDKSQIKNREVLDAIVAGEEPTGWIEIDERTGKKKIYMYLPNVRDTYEAEKTIAHETIGHYGLRELLGEKGYKSYMRSLLLDLKDPELSKYIKDNLSRNGFDMYRTIDEYLADAAEKGYGKLPFWMKVRDKFVDALRSQGFQMSPSISDVKYMVWLSKHRLEKGNLMDKLSRENILWKLGQERYEARIKNGEFGYSDGESAERTTDIPYFPGTSKTLFRHAPSVKNQKQNYERALNRLGYVWKESHLDHMQSAIELMRAMSGVKKIEDIPAAENFVLMENQISSKEEQIDYLFNRDYMEPLDKAVAKCLPDMGKGVDEQLRNLQLYMIKKHGLERNRYIPIRDQIRILRNDPSADQQQVDQLEQDYERTINGLRSDLRNGIIDLKEYFEGIDDWIQHEIDPNWKPGDQDYSGLSSLTGTKKTYDDAAIINDVMSTEAMLGKGRVDDLWEKTKAVSQFGLDMEYEGGLDSKEKHDKVSGMFEWYVPLRGYDEKVAEEVYDYLEEEGGNERRWAGPVLMNAKGRGSLSDVDVFATLGSMNSSAISRALRNQMKQGFARFVRNHYDKDANARLVTELPYLWAEKEYDAQGNEIWVEKFPDIPENAKADDIAQILDQYEQDMKAKAQNGDAKRIKQNSRIPYRPVKPEHKSQHIVDVWINGEKHAFVVNGNPRAAQAVNGQLKSEGANNPASRFVRIMAQLNTSYSPDFIVGNTERDFIFASTAIGIKENLSYWMNWEKNYFTHVLGREAVGVPAMHTNLFNRYRNGTLNMNNSTDRYFKEFMENGGETGWVETKNLEKWKDMIRNGVRKQGNLEKTGKYVVGMIPSAIEAMNERAENMARFATYLTSRQMGRSITRSVSDAKEVSVNFNRKGAGSKTKGFADGKGGLRKMNAILAARTAQFGQDYFMFYNAGVQGLNNAAKLTRDHPIKASTAFALFALGGILMPQLNQALIDDEDEKERGIKDPYAELPEWIRRNRLCIYKGKGEFITIDLPIELRALYGIGDMAAGYTTNPELRSDKPVWQDLMTQLTQLLPIDFMGEHPNQPLLNFVPSTLMPPAEALMNTNWYGRKIEKDKFIDEDAPRWKRAYQSTNRFYLDASKWLNAKTNRYSEEDLKKLGVPDGDIATADQEIKGSADGWLTDPSLIEHLINGYFGGAGQTAGRLAHVVKMSGDATLGEMLNSDKMPILRRLHYSPTDQNKMARTRNKWYRYQDEMKSVERELKVLREAGAHDPLSKMKQLSMEDSARVARMEMMKDSLKAYKRLDKQLKKQEKESQVSADSIQMRMDQLMENTVHGLDNLK